jgi:hypothetical protein
MANETKKGKSTKVHTKKVKTFTNEDSEMFIQKLHLENHHAENSRKICDTAGCPMRGRVLSKAQIINATTKKRK